MTFDDYESLVADATEGVEGALPSLQRMLAANPNMSGLLGDLNLHVQRHLIDMAAGDSIDVKESLKIMMARKRDELLTGGDSVPEQLLIHQVLSTMLDAACCQLSLSQPHAKESITRRMERRLTRAQARHQAAIQSLIEVRQMLAPPQLKKK
jgi:hypothetical protein